jgi:hypothetical protein
MMHLHGIYFLLSDLANLLLMQKGYLTLYASAVHDVPNNKGIVCFAPPNTGKTLTATRLCSEHGCRLIGEDIVIVRDRQLYACPWTVSYRKKKAAFDGAGAFGRASQAPEFDRCDTCALTDMVILASGEEQVLGDKTEALRRMAILNGYLFDYYTTPVIKLLGYFDDIYDRDWNRYAYQLLQRLTTESDCRIIYAADPLQFSTLIHHNLEK